MLNMKEDAEIIKNSLGVRASCLVGKINSMERLQNKVDDNRYYTRGVNNILYSSENGSIMLYWIYEKRNHGGRDFEG